MTLKEYLENYDEPLNERVFVVNQRSKTKHADEINQVVGETKDFIKHLSNKDIKGFYLDDLKTAREIIKKLKAIRIYDDCDQDIADNLIKQIRFKFGVRKSGIAKALKKSLFAENSVFNSVSDLVKIDEIIRDIWEKDEPIFYHKIQELINDKIRQLKGQKPAIKGLWKYDK
jgi:hypothetical protein